jgi:hypothetical protein
MILINKLNSTTVLHVVLNPTLCSKIRVTGDKAK